MLDRTIPRRQNHPMPKAHPFQVAALIGVVLATTPAFAQSLDGGKDGENIAAPTAERRDGFMASLGLNYGYGAIGGYPNKLGQIDNPGYYSEIKGVASTFSLVLGGALRDWLTVGLLIRAGGSRRKKKSSAAAAASACTSKDFRCGRVAGFGGTSR